jgi:protein-disulfide isomerase
MGISRWSLAPLLLIGLVGAWFALKPRSTEPQAALTSHSEEIFGDPDSPIGGNPEGNLTLVEFFDYNCPYCRQTAPLIAQMEAADPRLRVVYKQFPILGPGSVFAAKAALAAHRQEKFIGFHQALYQIRGPIDESRTLRAAEAAGLDVARLKSAVQDPAIEAMLSRNLALARLLGIDDTPGFVIGHRILVGFTQLNVLQAAIRGAREVD